MPVLALLAGSLCARAQTEPALRQRPQPSTITVTTRLVVLDVVVTDSKGNPRTDLQQSDFHITENGQPINIRTFEPPSVHTAPLAHDIESTADLGRYAPQSPVDIIVLDELNTKFEDMAYARYSVNKYLKAQPEKLTTPTMLLAVSKDSFKVLRDYTLDRSAIFTALDHHLTAYPWHLQVNVNPIRQLATSIGTLEQVVTATSGHPGHKNLIWIGKGFPGIDLTSDALDQQEVAQLTGAVEAAINRLRDGRVTLYTIDPTPLSSTIASTENDASTTGDDDGVSAPDPFAGDINFNSLAPQTGGKAYYSRNDIDRELEQTVRDGSNYYTISYRPPPSSADNMQANTSENFRKIRVRFDQKGLRADYRQGYYSRALENEVVDPRRVQYDLYAAETGTLSYTGFRVEAARKPGTPDTYIVATEEKQLQWIDNAPTNPAAPDNTTSEADTQSAKITLVATALDKQGKMLRRATAEFTAHRPSSAAKTAAPDAAARFEINLPDTPKTARTRFVLRGADGRIGTFDLDPNSVHP